MAYSYLFVFGRTPLLALAELKWFFTDIAQIRPDVACVSVSEPLDVTDCIGKLGGTVKIARVVGTVSHVTAQDLVLFIPAVNDVRFGVSLYDSPSPKTLLSDMKDLLKTKGVRAQYLTNRHGSQLSSVTVDKRHASELIVVRGMQGFIVGQTEAVQLFESWAARDYGRPFADPKAGMLPPKVARMAVNLARPIRTRTLLDPFCGMGTILAEAYSMGWRVLGSDSDTDAVRKATSNLAWHLSRVHGKGAELIEIVERDAVHVSDALKPESVDAIVTEPFMGSTRWGERHAHSAAGDGSSDVRNTIKGLEKLYIGCLRDWAKILVSGGLVIIALPEYAVGGKIYFVKKVIDMCENLGYTIVDGPIEYSRPHATVRRKFFVFRKLD